MHLKSGETEMNPSITAEGERSISVIIPTCDRPPEYLRQAISSAASQSLRPTEIIVVDNGVNEVPPMELPNGVRVYRTAPRIGPSKARNIGVELSTGTHLAFLDDDDWWDKDFLLEAVKAMGEGSTRCVYGRIRQSKNGEISDQRNLTPETATLRDLLERNPGTSVSNLVIEMTLFDQIGRFDEKLLISEDRALAIEALLIGEKIGIARNAISFARHHDGDHLKTYNGRKIAFIMKYRKLMPASLLLRHLLKFGLWIHIRPRRT